MAPLPVTVTVTDKNGQMANSVGGSVTPGTTGLIQIGETTLQATEFNNHQNLLFVQPITLTQAASIKSLSFYVTATGGQLRLCVYTSTTSGFPGTLVAQTAAFTPVAGWNTQVTTTTPTLQAGNYFLGYLPQSNSLGFLKGATGGPSYFGTVTFGSLPTTFPATTPAGLVHWSLYGTFTGSPMPTVWVNSVAPGGIVPPSSASTPTSSSDIWISLDGRLNAPSGAAQYPTLLNGYAPSGSRVRTGQSIATSISCGVAQPPWMVAGVDYRVGPPAGQVFKDPSTNPPAGSSYDGANAFGPILSLLTSGTIVDGYDFSTVGAGIRINVAADGCQILRSKFVSAGTLSSNFGSGSGAGGIITSGDNFSFTLMYCTVDGGATSTAASSNSRQSALIQIGQSSAIVFQYNQFSNYCQHVIELNGGTSVAWGSVDHRFNIVDDSPSVPGAHYNWLQPPSGSSASTLSSMVLAFNFTRQVSLGGAEGWQPACVTNQDMSINNNTYYSALNGGNTVMSNFHHVNDCNFGNTINGTATINSNYGDVSGLLSHQSDPTAYNFDSNMPPGTAGTPPLGTWQWSSASLNVDMLSGRYISSNGKLL